MTKFQPLADNVLIEPLDDSQVGSLIIAEEDKKVVLGKVVSTGNGWHEFAGIVHSRLQLGDTVWFSVFSKREIRLDGKLYYIVPEREVLGYKREDSSPS